MGIVYAAFLLYGLIFNNAVLGKPATIGNAVHLVTRQDWGARPTKGSEAMPTPVGHVFVHHTAMSECTTQDECSAEMRKIQNFHMDVRGWDDIGYNFLIGEDGQVYEGRGWDRVGAHTRGWNNVSIAFSVMGNYMTHLPNQKALDALTMAIIIGVSNDKIKPDYKVYGHRDVGSTECPGDHLYELIKTWTHYGQKPPVKPTASQ